MEKIEFFVYAVTGSLSSFLWSILSVLGYFLAIKEHSWGPTEMFRSPEDTMLRS